jgi:8-oxo-dGTP pyrophosphatase MutT (NUDIX family)
LALAPRDARPSREDNALAAPRFRHIRHIHATLDTGPWAYAERQRQAIDSAWTAATAANPALFNGQVLLLCESQIDGETLAGRYKTVLFAEFLHYMRHGEPDGVTKNGFALAGLVAADGALAMGVMGGHTANAGKIYFPGGTPDLDDVVEGRVDLAGSARRELEEETGLRPDEVAFDQGFWLFEDDKRLAFTKIARSPLPGDALRHTILQRLATQVQPELADIHLVRSADDLLPERMPSFQVAFAEWWLGGGAEAAAQPG